ncbi:hypothetical protein Dda_1004 [Drechslerella dactyloides]|uniref:WHIM1 domain-containing protein n=1 Tax=Drechslerella dactyloides TaxID=74499 RepID=A0AAD6NMJ4_DREDA|nr:hypothetical protein Dda_1004 [Drechslerella dactyloides]
MSSRSSSPLSSAQDLSDPELDIVAPAVTSKAAKGKTTKLKLKLKPPKMPKQIQKKKTKQMTTKQTAAAATAKTTKTQQQKVKKQRTPKQQQPPPPSDSDDSDEQPDEDADDVEGEVDVEAEAEASPPPHKRRKVVDPRDPLPQDNPRYAFIVAFQAKFNQVFRGVPNLGPQDIESGITETPISDQIESLLCKLLSLALNRQKQVEKGHYGKALEDAVANYIDEAPPEWGGRNPLEGGRTFNQMTVDERLVMLQTLILWVLRHSRVVGDILKEVYKPGRKTDDSNIPLAVHCWGMDREKNKYYLIEGKDDTHFRVYQEYISPGYRTARWISVAGTIDELRDLAARLGEEGSRNAKELQGKILVAIPRFEEGEQKRKRREYRHQRKAQFLNPGVSLYEGRTRGHKAKYTFESDDDGGYTSGRATRSNRASGRVSPAENYVTGSGRVTRRTNQYGFSSENNEVGTGTGTGTGTPYAGSDSGGSARRSGRMTLKRDRGEYEAETAGMAGDTTAPIDDEEEEEEQASDSGEEGSEGGDDYKDEEVDEMDDDDLTDASDEDDALNGKTLITKLKFTTGEGKAALAKLSDGSDGSVLVHANTHGGHRSKEGVASSPPPIVRLTPAKDESAMDIDMAEDVDDTDVDLVPTSSPRGGGQENMKPEHVVVNFLSGKGSNSSPASSISQ